MGLLAPYGEGSFKDGENGHVEQKCPLPANSKRSEDLETSHPRPGMTASQRSPRGRTRGEGGELLAAGRPPRGLGLIHGRPSQSGMSHSHCERGRGTGERVGGPLAAAARESTPFWWRLRRCLPGRGLFSFPSGDGDGDCDGDDGGLDLGPHNAPRGERGSLVEEKCRKRGARTENERACVRARGGKAGRRLVTQQNARAESPRVRSLCF